MLTDAQCRGAKGKSKAYKITDADGLFLYVTPSGYRSWRYRYRFSGKQRQVVLGSYPDITLREARDLRDEQKRVLRSGNDPANEARRQAMIAEASAAHTFEIVARQWHQGQVARWKPVHAKDVIESLERDIFPEIGSLPLASIDAPLLLATIEPVQKRGAIETGHRLRQRISAVFQFGIAKGLIQIDPAASIGAAMTAKPVGRRWPAVTTIEDARAVLKTTDSAQASPTVILASRFLAITAQRPGMLRWLKWNELYDIDLAGRGESLDALWKVPASKLKQEMELRDDDKFEHLVPLSAEAVDVLRTSYLINSSSDYVFPGGHSILKPMSENALNFLFAREGLKGVHVPHGWRSSFSTLMNEWAIDSGQKHDRKIIDLMLAHRPTGVSATELKYNRAAYMNRRRYLADTWSAMLLQGAPKAGEIINGRRRRKS